MRDCKNVLPVFCAQLVDFTVIFEGCNGTNLSLSLDWISFSVHVFDNADNDDEDLIDHAEYIVLMGVDSPYLFTRYCYCLFLDVSYQYSGKQRPTRRYLIYESC